jgi:tetratricopeptide (TPR) repeat protein
VADYEAVRPGGLLVQWIQGYSIFPDDLRMVLATVAGQFPSVSVWRGEEPDFLLLARMDRNPLSLGRLRDLLRVPAISADLDALNVSVPEAVLAYHRLDDQDLRRFVAGERHNTDDNTLLEFHAPRALLRHGLYEQNIETVWRARSSAVAQDVRVEDSRAALLAAADAALWNDDWTRAATFLGGVRGSAPSAFSELLEGRLAFGTEDYVSAGEHYSAALRIDPSLTAAARGLAEVARHNDDLDTAYLLYRQVLAREPDNLPAHAGIVKVLDRKHEREQAAVWLAKKLQLDSEPDSSEFALLGDFFVETGHSKQAANEYEEAIRRDRYSYAGHRGLGDLYRAQGKWEKARENYEFAARFDPESSSEVFVGLADAYRHLGRVNDARRTIEKGLRLFPGDAILAGLSSDH